MKFNSLTIVLGVLVCFITGCKYEDGPGISFICREKRVSGAYDIAKFEIGGRDLTDSLKKNLCYDKIIFSKEGTFKSSSQEILCAFHGNWDLSHNDEKLGLQFFVVDTLIEPLGSNWTLYWDILRLSDDEMNLSITYDNQFIKLNLKQ